MADGERHRLWTDTGFVDADQRDGIRERHICVDDFKHCAERRHAIRERDLYANRCHRLQLAIGWLGDSHGEQGYAYGFSLAHG
jgi:hypothetical protein